MSARPRRHSRRLDFSTVGMLSAFGLMVYLGLLGYLGVVPLWATGVGLAICVVSLLALETFG